MLVKGALGDASFSEVFQFRRQKRRYFRHKMIFVIISQNNVEFDKDEFDKDVNCL